MKINVQDGSFDTYVARPQTADAPTVVVLQEIFGVNADLRATCDELASAGFLAVAPDLFWRDAPGLDLNAWSEEEWKRGFELYEAFDLDRGVEDIRATIAAARLMDGGSGKVGVTGYCLGGLLTYLTAARTDVDAAVAYYGGNTQAFLDEAGGIVAPLMMHLGEEDEFISKDAQASIKAAIESKSNVQIFSYPGCAHAFARHTGSHYDAQAATLANGRTRAFLAEKLAG